MNLYTTQRGTIIMTKIKNTKKGMAKKTLSMSLVVAMLATSNVPVWAAEFSDGTDAAVATETFSDETADAPVVDNEEVAPVAEAATNNKLNAKVEFEFGGSAVKNNSVTWDYLTHGKLTAKVTVSAGESNLDDFKVNNVREIKALWKVDGNQAAAAVDVSNGTETPVDIEPTDAMAEAGSKLTLYIYAKDANGIAWEYTSDPISVEKVDINTVQNQDQVKIDSASFIYNGKDHTVDNSMIQLPATWKNPGNWSENDFTIGVVSGDTKNVTDDGITVTLTPKKAGFSGALTRKIKITPLTLDDSSKITDHIKAEVVTTAVAYTGKDISPKNTDVKLVDKDTGADLSGYIASVAPLTGNDKNAGKAKKLTITLNEKSEGTAKNYKITANPKTITTGNMLTVTARDLSTVDVKVPEISFGTTAINGNNVKFYDKTTGEELTLKDDVTFDAVPNAVGTYEVKVTPSATGNVTGETKATVRVTDSASLSGATFKNTYATAAEEYTGEQIVKDVTKLGDVYINGTKLDSSNYKIEFGKNIDAGANKGVIRIVGQNSYKNSVEEVTFNINKAVVSADTVTYNKVVEKKDTATPSAYKDAIGLVVKAKNANGKEFTLTEGTDYTVKYEFKKANGTDAGTGDVTDIVKTTITVKSNSNYTADSTSLGLITTTDTTLSVSPKITNKMIKDADIRLKQTSYTYTGAGITPKYDVVVDGRVLVEGTDYKVSSISKNVNVGTATLEIVGMGDYSADAKAKATFSIVAADASKLTGVIASQPYTGYAIDPAASQIDLTLDGVKINVNDNFTLSYGENIKIGEGTVTLTPKNGNFTGTKTINFKISGKMLSGGTLSYYDENGLTASLNNKPYTGKEITAAKTVFGTTGTRLNGGALSDKLTEGTDYEIKYVDNVYGKAEKGASTTAQKGAVLVIAKGNYAGNYTDPTNAFVVDGIYTDANGNKITNVVFAQQFEIDPESVAASNVSIKNGTYAAGLLVKPTVIVTVKGRTLVEGIDYDLDLAGNKDLVNATEKKSLTVTVVPKNGYRGTGLTFSWGIDKFDLANADVSVKDGNVTVKCGSITVPAADYTVTKDAAADKVTVTAAKDSKNYTGSKTVSADVAPEEKPDAPMISNVKVVGNKATVILSGEASGAAGYDYVISTDRDCITNKAYDGVSKNQATTSTAFDYVQQGTYYAYCHAWKRDENGKKVFSDWSNAYPFVVGAITPDAPVITSVKVSGSTVTVTYKAAENATGYDVVLGTATKKVNGETRPVEYGTLVKKNIKGNVVTATFKNVKKGTYYAGLHAFNRTNPTDNKKVFSQWSNVKKVNVK